MVHTYEVMLGGRAFSIEAGRLAEQANGAVQVRYGDTVVLATATMSRQPRTDVDFFPLTVDYEERLYAAGKIPGGFFKREGRPAESAILICRLTDRPIRPLFPKGFRNDVQVVVSVLSADQENEPDTLAIVGASTALMISDIPFGEPIGAVKVGYIDGQFVLNPLASQYPNSLLELTVAGTEDAVEMVEAGASEVPESLMLDAIKFGQSALQDLIKLQLRIRQAIGKPKFVFPVREIAPEIRETVRSVVGDRLREAVYQPDKRVREALRDELTAEATAKLGERGTANEVAAVFEELEMDLVRSTILDRGERPDGRDLTTIRPVSCEVGLLPRTHGSGLFNRGQTQVLSIATLGSRGEEQTIEGLGLAERKRFMHHYNFPPYSTGEVKRLGAPGRREIGHGALAERALMPVVPSAEEFPYTIRLVSEVLSSNGSTSMGSVCGSTLALMDAGVPIKAPVAGVAMGLVTDDQGRFAVLTDIQGIEDHLGDMDFKVAGTAQGVTALQMDLKMRGLRYDIMERALAQAREGRLFILDKMLQVLPAPRPELSPLAPRVYKTRIPVDKIGALIGPGGKTVRGLQEEHGVKIDIEEDGTVLISSVDAEGAQRALRVVERLGKDVEIGQDYLGRVTRITNFGAFVEILPGKEGLVRLDHLAEYRVNRPEDVVSVGDEIMVRVIEIDPQGRINLSRRAVLEGSPARVAPGGLGPAAGGPPPRRGPGGGFGGVPGAEGPAPERRPGPRGGFGGPRGGGRPGGMGRPSSPGEQEVRPPRKPQW
ncbi:MAG: polyribonucleotide nucleotidyltransferase [Chloroflexi bacterium]|nr:polyribonucleotide nucleotidyltransferase [Chloroflexota bacterium]